MAEENNAALLAAVPGASLAGLNTRRASSLAAEIKRLDTLVAEQAGASLDFFDAPADFRTALATLA